MVKRCGFYISKGKLCRKDVLIDWDLGFDRDAKAEYIERIKRALGEDLMPSIDVTTASTDAIAKRLSPYYVILEDGVSVEDAWKEIKITVPEVCKIPGMFDFIYLNGLNEWQRDYVKRMECFIDVFHNPDKAFNTQAKALAVFKLLNVQGKQEYLEDCNAFVKWYKQNCMKLEVQI